MYYAEEASYRIHFNFHRVKLSWITNFHCFSVFIFMVCDVIAHVLLIWSKLTWDETSVDGY